MKCIVLIVLTVCLVANSVSATILCQMDAQSMASNESACHEMAKQELSTPANQDLPSTNNQVCDCDHCPHAASLITSTSFNTPLSVQPLFLATSHQHPSIDSLLRPPISTL